MEDQKKTKEQLILELAKMHQRISELEKSEDKRKKAEDILKESEAILRTLINATRETLIMIDTEDRVLLANEVVAQRLGKSSQELIGTCLYDHFPPDIAKSRKEHFDKVAITGESIRFEDTRAGRFYEIYCYPVFNEEGKVSRLVIFARDITDRKEAEDMVRESEEKYNNSCRCATPTLCEPRRPRDNETKG
ncbi:MAG: PAS domain-containing protein [Proteobacteria bacterium]|nr:PAS domain-containing protein [Pseudomonadota bacterium]